MNDNNNNVIESQAEQCQWLDVSYTARQYSQTIDNSTDSVAKKVKFHMPKLGKRWKVACLTALTAFVMVSAFFVGNSGVLGSAKDTYLASVFGSSDGTGSYQSISLPYNVELVSVGDGVATFDGGSIIVSFTDGTVTSIVDESISVAVDDNITLVYGGVVECYVVEGAQVSCTDVLAKYLDTATVSILYADQLVTNVVGSQYLLQWSV